MNDISNLRFHVDNKCKENAYNITLENSNYVSWAMHNTTFHQTYLSFFVLFQGTDCPFLLALYQHCSVHSDIFQFSCHNNEGIGSKSRRYLVFFKLLQLMKVFYLINARM